MTTRKRILIVEDEQQNLDLLQAFLESFGYESEMAHHGFEALFKLNLSVDLVLLVVLMPGWTVSRLRGPSDATLHVLTSLSLWSRVSLVRKTLWLRLKPVPMTSLPNPASSCLWRLPGYGTRHGSPQPN